MNILRKILSGIFKTQAQPQPEPPLELDTPAVLNMVTNFRVTEVLPWPTVRSRSDIMEDIQIANNLLENTFITLELPEKLENLDVLFMVTPVGLEIQLSDDKNKPFLIPNIPFQKTTPGDEDALGREASRIMEELEKTGFSFGAEYLSLAAIISIVEAWNPEAQITRKPPTFVEPLRQNSSPGNQIR